ncbi:MAG: carbohydrate kinase family protein [Ruminococcus sp.]|nr:carbohydrate kinase family protein [Ruminococcus sp.]
MSRILVCGLINVETTVKIDGFPLEYCPIDYNFFGVNSYPAGVGLNLSLSLSTLSDEVRLLSMVSDDCAGAVVKDVLVKNGVSTDYLLNTGSTAQSVVLYDNDGRRRIFCDLKDLQERSFDEKIFIDAVKDCDAVCLCNINFSRNLLKIAKDMGKIIATDIHVQSDINDEYNRDFMKNADILFLSNEGIIGREKEFLMQLKDTYKAQIIVVGMGENGSMMYVRADDNYHHRNAVKPAKIVNTVGAGDSLFSSFVHFYVKGVDPYTSLEYATHYASHKIGFDGAAKGFLTEKQLLEIVNRV